MSKQVPVDGSAIAQGIDDDGMHQVAPDVAYKRLGMVNVAYVGHSKNTPGWTGDWVLVDAGLPGTKGMISKAATEHFGSGVSPVAIVLTHGHIDHAGALEDLAKEWNVPI